MKSNDYVIIQQLLGITILSEKANVLREHMKVTRDSITEENAKINACQDSNARVQRK